MGMVWILPLANPLERPAKIGGYDRKSTQKATARGLERREIDWESYEQILFLPLVPISPVEFFQQV